MAATAALEAAGLAVQSVLTTVNVAQRTVDGLVSMQYLADKAVDLAYDALEYIARAKLDALSTTLKSAQLVLIAADRTVSYISRMPL